MLGSHADLTRLARRQGVTRLYIAAVLHLQQLSRFDLLAAGCQLLLLAITLATVVVYLIKRSGNRKANVFFAVVLSSFGLSIGALVIEHLGLTGLHPRLRYLPIWMTWTIGPAWFFYVKLTLFPAYRLRATDIKHAIMPASQLVYYAYCFAVGADGLRQDFLFGFAASTYEEFIFFVSVLGYLFAAYRYLRFRARAIGDQPLRWDYWRVKQLRHVQRVLVALLIFNFGFVVYNFVITQTSGTGLLHLRGFYASSSLSFGLILLYLLRGVAHRQHFSAMVPRGVLAQAVPAARDAPAQRLETLLTLGRGATDPNVHAVRAARSVGVPPSEIDGLARQLQGVDFEGYVRSLRLAEVARLRADGRSLYQATLEAGFATRRAALRAFGARGG